MSNSKNNRNRSSLENSSKYGWLTRAISYIAPKCIQNSAEDHDHQNEVIQHETQDCSASNELFNDHRPHQSDSEHDESMPRTNILSNTVVSKLSISTYSSDEKSINYMKKEEKRMVKNLKSMTHGKERMKYEIKLMKYRENRMEHEIELMKHREKSVEEIALVSTSIYDQELSIDNEIKRMKTREKHMSCEIERMEHYETRLIDEVRSIENEIKHQQYFPTSNYHSDQKKIKYNKYIVKVEELCQELTKLTEHSNAIKIHKTKLDEYYRNRIKYENNLEIIRKKIVEERQSLEDAIEKRRNSNIQLWQCRAERLKLEINLLKSINERANGELQVIENDKKRREYLLLYDKLNEELSIKSEKVHTLWKTEQTCIMKSQSLASRAPSANGAAMYQRSIELRDMSDEFPPVQIEYETSSMVWKVSKYDIFITSAYQNDSIIGRIRKILPQHLSIHVKGYFSSTNIKIYLDNTSAAVIAIVNKAYELNEACQADMIHIFKRQFPLVLIITDTDFKPSTNWFKIVWDASNTQKVFLDFTNFEEKLLNAITDAQWNLPSTENNSETRQLISDERSKRFLGDVHEWTIAYSDPAQISHHYRQLINDPLRIATNSKLQDFYYNYIRIYFEQTDVVNVIKKGASENNVRHFLEVYTQTGPFSTTLNRHLATNILFYFEPTLHDNVDYQLVKCLVDFVALCIYREELNEYLFRGTVYRGVVMCEDDLYKYVVGSRIMNTSFLSTSKDKEVAEVFSGQKEQKFAVLCTYVINNANDRRSALDIEYISHLLCEREVLILPFSSFYVKSVTRPSYESGPIEMTLVEDDLKISKSIDSMTFTEQFS